ncbi:MULTISPECIES: hypothetical protein [Prochlorococcus]|uniref:hypothetical protein n=1 Tax=Prochlorococcus TaxID=1218 RepID=UPI00145F29EB|nr:MULTISPECIES: hypothetical protein [Prochlorococcus]NMP05477.1 hypothetical protein [Prochlorococcus sp. P1361]NMP13055.1 hypothetical protein [Prochlorococcus sp.P1363]
MQPLPNGAIDSMLQATPVLCFAEACGLASLLEQQPALHQACVSTYFDIKDLAQKALAVLQSPKSLEHISKLSQQQAKQWFHFPSYVHSLVSVGDVANQEVKQENKDIQRLLNPKLFDRIFQSPGTNLSDLERTQRYVLAWRSNIRTRKPVPGFHPGIYREQQRPSISKRDPLASTRATKKPLVGANHPTHQHDQDLAT